MWWFFNFWGPFGNAGLCVFFGNSWSSQSLFASIGGAALVVLVSFFLVSSKTWSLPSSEREFSLSSLLCMKGCWSTGSSAIAAESDQRFSQSLRFMGLLWISAGILTSCSLTSFKTLALLREKERDSTF